MNRVEADPGERLIAEEIAVWKRVMLDVGRVGLEAQRRMMEIIDWRAVAAISTELA